MSPGNNVASDETVALYALLFRAGRPLSFAEICDGLPPAFRNHATLQYKEWAKGQPDNHVNAIKGELPDEVRQRAWEWWVDGLLQSSIHSRRIAVNRRDGQPASPGQLAHLKLAEKVWSAIPDRAPIVEVVTYIEKVKHVRWTPTGAGDAAPRQVVKARYLNANDEMLDIVKQLRSKDRDRLAEHLQNGAFALDDQPKETG